MSLTQLDPNVALVLIDLQKGIVNLPVAHSSAEVVERAAKLAKAFREKNLPVVLVNVAGPAPGRTDAGHGNYTLPPDWTELVPEIDAQPGDIRITKHSFGAFPGTELDKQLRERGVTQIVFAGVATSIGIESTARCAYDLGYHVVLVTDAMTDMNAEAHANSVQRIFPRIGESEITDNVLKKLRGE